MRKRGKRGEAGESNWEYRRLLPLVGACGEVSSNPHPPRFFCLRSRSPLGLASVFCSSSALSTCLALILSPSVFVAVEVGIVHSSPSL
ncbi:hypothetical protein BHE74_00026484 [Ensete ventricosum]|nr:hypothetical protein GW17_00009577 [Ensete ventricosum]RWW66162.1 hypothetical protein BHE74_00026484 [Ensete ventricosum]RZR92351.1 hypothetical protein BHM03_00020625 [Ensete ventricosum]